MIFWASWFLRAIIRIFVSGNCLFDNLQNCILKLNTIRLEVPKIMNAWTDRLYEAVAGVVWNRQKWLFEDVLCCVEAENLCPPKPSIQIFLASVTSLSSFHNSNNFLSSTPTMCWTHYFRDSFSFSFTTLLKYTIWFPQRFVFFASSRSADDST